MTKIHEHQQRVVRGPITMAADGREGRITARVLTYGTVDTYDTTFRRGVFNASMDERMPRIVWSHDWSDVIGVWTGYTEDENGLTLTGQLDDFDAVPRARQAWAQLRSGSIDQFSVGFWPEEAVPTVHEGREILEFTKGVLDEASLVMVGAVPGTELVSLRDASNAERIVQIVQDGMSAGADTNDIVERVTALAEPEVDDDEIVDDDDVYDIALPDLTVEQLQDFGVLADAGMEAAQEVLDEYAHQADLDPDLLLDLDYAGVVDVLLETLDDVDDDLSDENDDPALTGHINPPDEDSNEGGSVDDDAGGTTPEATVDQELDDAIADAFSILDAL